jgi:hypothetical protein
MPFTSRVKRQDEIRKVQIRTCFIRVVQMPDAVCLKTPKGNPGISSRMLSLFSPCRAVKQVSRLKKRRKNTFKVYVH